MQDYFADEIGVLSPNQQQVDELYAGEVRIDGAFADIFIVFYILLCLACSESLKALGILLKAILCAD